MTVLSPRVHGFFDHGIIAAFTLGPSLVGFEGTPAVLSYGAASVLLALTLLSSAPDVAGAPCRLWSFATHGLLELAVAMSILAAPWTFGFAQAWEPRSFFIALALLMITVWLLTDHHGVDDALHPDETTGARHRSS